LYDQDGFLSIDSQGIEWCDADVHYLVSRDGKTVFCRAYDESGRLISLEGSILTSDGGLIAGRVDPVIPSTVYGHELTLFEIEGAFHVNARYQDEEELQREPQVCDVLVGAGERYYLFFDTLGETGDPFSSAGEAWAYVHHYLTEADARAASPPQAEAGT
jgi:hypothetical protein